MSRTLQDWLNWQETLHPSEIDLGLGRVEQVLYQLLSESKSPACQVSKNSETPQFSLSYTVVTVAGTNGKGSTVALLEAIFSEAGYRVGSYTSPHLLEYNERIKINQVQVTDELLCDSFERIDKARGDLSLTYFEFGTLAAIDIFCHQLCEIVILEVGLGGRLDAVNVINPDVALVTTVDIDHQDWLGSDREMIGIEKAGIYRNNKPAIFGDIDCPKSILDRVARQKLTFYQYSVDYQYEARARQWDWLVLNHTPDKKAELFSRYNLPLPNLNGAAQLKNAANVLMVLELLKESCPVTQADIKRGLLSVQLPGRFQIFSTKPFIILDVAHNVQAAKILRNSLEQLNSIVFEPESIKAPDKKTLKASDTQPPKASDVKSLKASGKLHVIVGMLKDKDVLEVLSVLAPIVDSWRIIELDTPRAMPAKDIEIILKNNSPLTDGIDKKIQCFSNFELAFHDFNANKLMLNSIDKLLIFGSFFTVTDALHLLQSSDTPIAHE
jgi:dihydrofolate synthase/folylpolyglutamate synthase